MADLWWCRTADVPQGWLDARRHWLEDAPTDTEKQLSQLWRRELLARYVGQAPATLSFVANEKGKPALTGSHWHFSVSHGGGWHLLLIAEDPCGVDVEAWQRDVTRFLQPAALRRFAEKEQLEQGDAATFLRCWTLKEAWAKCLGLSVWEVLALPLAGRAGCWQVPGMASGHAELPACVAWVVRTTRPQTPYLHAWRPD